MDDRKYIDIFAGCGGLSIGLLESGWTGLFAIEKNADAFSTFKHNLIDKGGHFIWPSWLPVKENNIDEIIERNAHELRALRGSVALVAGGPPCQGFSMAGRRNQNDQRNELVKSYIRFVGIVLPEVLIFENVRGFSVRFKDQRTISKYSSYVEESLKSLGYNTAHRIADMSHYGIPQKRKRFILVAMRNHSAQEVFECLDANVSSFCSGKGISSRTTVHEAISDLEMIHGVAPSPDTKGYEAGLYGAIQSGYQKLMRQGLGMAAAVADSHRFVHHRQDTAKLHETLLKVAPLGKRIGRKDPLVPDLKRRGVTVLDKASQAPTLTSIPDELVHYSEPRILTVREYARLQSFPDWFEFKGKYTSGGKLRVLEVPRYTQVGNAVPPLFAEQMGRAIIEVLNERAG